MRRLATVIVALVVSIPAMADGTTFIDLRTPQALENLKRQNPAHFEKIRQILAGLEEKPERAEGDWLQANFPVRDVELSRLLLKTSDPPRQLLRFTLDDTRYTLHVTRSDLVAEPQVVR